MQLVFLAVIPPPPLFAELRERMEHYSAQLGSSKALHLPPHITLVPPFVTAHFPELLDELASVCASLRSFTVEFEQLHSFGSKVLVFDVRADYIRVVHEALLEPVARYREHRFKGKFSPRTPKRHKELIDLYGDHKVMEFFHPHLTLAKGDIDAHKLQLLLASPVDEPIRVLAVQEIAVLVHSPAGWQVVATLPLEQT